MADYKKMYKILFNSMTDIAKIIERTQREVEDIYINSDEKPVILYNNKGEKLVYKNWDEANKAEYNEKDP